MNLKILVCGSRNWTNEDQIFEVLNHWLDIVGFNITIIHGGCPTGADNIVDNWARENRLPRAIYRAEWDKYGKSAGPIRNQQMLEGSNPDFVLAFQSGRTPGTTDMILRANKSDVMFKIYKEKK